MWFLTILFKMNRSNTVKRTFFKAYVVVNVHHLSSGHVNQNVVKVTVAKANNVSHHWHDSSRSGVGLQTEKRKQRNIWITFLSICPFLKQETRKKVRNALNASPRYLSDPPPLARCGARTPELLGQKVGRRCFHQLFQNLLHNAERPVSPCHIHTQPHCL